jgi:hypothetical protein
VIGKNLSANPYTIQDAVFGGDGAMQIKGKGHESTMQERRGT